MPCVDLNSVELEYLTTEGCFKSIPRPESGVVNSSLSTQNTNHLTKKQQQQISQDKLDNEMRENNKELKIARKLLEIQRKEMESIYKKR